MRLIKLIMEFILVAMITPFCYISFCLGFILNIFRVTFLSGAQDAEKYLKKMIKE